MKLASTLLAGLLALNTASIDAAAAPRGARNGPAARPELTAKKKALRSVTAAELAAQAKADPKQVLAELRTGLRITGVNGITGATAVLTTVSEMLGAEVANITLRLRRNNLLLLRVGKAAAPSATTPATSPGEPAEAAEDDED